MELELTKDSDYLICVLYEEYLSRLKNGISKLDAKYFDGPEILQELLIPQWTEFDVEETCRELSRAHLIKGQYSDNHLSCFELLDSAIIYMENRFGRKVDKLFKHITDLKKLIF